MFLLKLASNAKIDADHMAPDVQVSLKTFTLPSNVSLKISTVPHSPTPLLETARLKWAKNVGVDDTIDFPTGK